MDQQNATQQNKPETVCGWLSLRTVFSKKWKRQWFRLERNHLLYGDSEKEACKKIELEGARLQETHKDQRPAAFSVKPVNGRRTFYISADDDMSRLRWMQAICFAKVSQRVD